jgi:arylsulfatase A-like enzyme
MTTLDSKLPESQHTLAERFRSAGYATVGFSANFIVVNANRGFAQGFDRFDELNRERTPSEPEDLLGRVAADAREVTDRALDWLRQPPSTPFFLYVHYMDPHSGYHPPPDYVRQVTGEPEARDSIDGATERLKRVLRKEARLGEEDRLRLIDLYDGEIAFTDAELGRLLGELRSRKLLDRSIVAVLADHGEEFLDHGGLMHGLTLYRELIHVPLILRWPGAGGPARRVAELVGLTDVAPTLLDLAGVRDDPPVAGRSLAGWLRGEGEAAPSTDRFAYSELDRDQHLAAEIRREPVHRAAVTGPRWTFLAGASSGRELYDLGADPLQRVDRADSEPQLAGAMQQQLDRHLAEQPRTSEVERVPLDDAEKERLRALGYLD